VALRRFLCASVGAALLGFCVGAAAAQGSGETLVELLEVLRAQGMDVLYSSDLVKPDMRAPALPGVAPLDRARQALATHGLVLQSIGSGRFIVTQAPVAATPSDGAARAAEPATISEVSVYASRYELGTGPVGEPRFLSSTQIEQVPGSQDDALRAARVFPGVASNLSARPFIRGSSGEDVLVQFDGVPLADPFHLKNFQSLISAFDPAAVERIEIYSGGFPVRYGTKSGGVIDVTPRSVPSGYDYAVGASLLAYDASTVGHAEQWPLEWLATVRHSVKDVVLKPVNAQEGEPQFMDSLGRLRWHDESGGALTLGWLLLDDRIDVATTSADELTSARYRDEYTWIGYERAIGERLHSRTVLSGSWSERSRNGALEVPGIAMEHLQESRHSSSIELRSSWTYGAPRAVIWNTEIEGATARADLAYDRTGRFTDEIAASFARNPDNDLHARATPAMDTYAVATSVRKRWSRLEAELGVRVDAQRYRGYGLAHQVSPRLNLRYDLAPGWRLYSSGGRFGQAQRVDELRLEEQQVRPDAAALADHAILGVAYESPNGLRFSAEVYRKRWTRVTPYFDNLFATLSLVPDLQPDRVRVGSATSEASGLELSVRRTFTPSLEGWAAYALSRVADDVGEIDVPRAWDQPHAFNAGLAWSEGRWSGSALFGWHRGWPRTTLSWDPSRSPLPLAVGERNDARWGDYFTLDLSAAWKRHWTSGELSVWLELTNSLDRRNDCCLRLTAPQLTEGRSIADPNYWMGRTLNAGFSWRVSGP
jgi:outer membrane receptor protein involved in Fe transport